MIIRYLQQKDDLLEISNIYECSWKYAYRDIIPQDYLNSIPKAKVAGQTPLPKQDFIHLY